MPELRKTWHSLYLAERTKNFDETIKNILKLRLKKRLLGNIKTSKVAV